MNRNLTCSRSMVVVASAIGASLFVSSFAEAAPTVFFDVTVNGGTGGPSNYMWSQTGVPTGGANPGEHTVASNHGSNPHGGPLFGPFGEWSINSWNFIADDNPDGAARLGAVFSVTNGLAHGPTEADNHLQFSIYIYMAVTPASNTTFFGNGGINLLVPGSGNGHINEIRALNGPIWNYTIDGVDVASLFQQGFFWGGSGGSTQSTSASLSTPVNQVAPLAGISPAFIGIRLDFDLTPGETVEFNGVFGFIPAPGCLSLLALAAIGRRSRRRLN